MAFTAREVIMTFRGQNYLSSALRRVGRDVGALSRTQQLNVAAQQAAITRSRLVNQQGIQAAELASVTTGQRRLALDRASASLGEVRANAATRLRSLEEAAIVNSNALIRNNERLARIAEAEAKGKAFVGTGVSRMEITAAYTVAADEQQRLMMQAATLNKQLEDQGVVMSNLDINTAQLTERDAALVARQYQLKDALATTDEALAAQDARMAQLNMQIAALPWQRVQDGIRTVEHFGRVLQMFGLIGVATFGYLAKSAADFTTQATLAATQVVSTANKSVATTQKVGGQISGALTNLLASGQTLASPSDLTKGVYDVFSGLSLPGNQRQQVQAGIDIIKQFSQVYQANYGMVQFNDVVQAGITIMNDFGVSAKNLPKALNEMQAAVRYGRMNMGQFVSTFNQAAPAAKAAGISFNEMADSITFLSRKFPSIRMAATGYARLLEILRRNSQAFHAFGIEVDDARGRMMPLQDIFRQLDERFPGLKTGAQDFGSVLKQITGQSATIQARRVGVYFAQNLGQYHNLAQLVEKDNNELVRSAIAAGTSPGVAWARFTNQLRGLVLLIGQGAIPAFALLGRPIQAFVNWITSLSPHTQHLIGYIGALAAAVALLGGTLLAVGGMFASWIISLRLLIGFMREGQGIFKMFGFAAKGASAEVAALGSEAGVVSIALAKGFGVVGIIATLVIYRKQVEGVVSALGGLGNAIAVVTAAWAAYKFAFIIASSGVAFEALATAITVTTEAVAGLSFVEILGSLGAITASITTATIAAVGLRTALMGIAGLVITATIIVLERHKLEAAGRSALGDTLAKEIDPQTGLPKSLSTGQKISRFLFGPPPSITQMLGPLLHPGHHAGSVLPGWQFEMDRATTGIAKVSLAYRRWLQLLDRRGSPAALKAFLEMFQRAGLAQASSTTDIKDWLNTIGRAAYTTRGVHDLNTQLKLVAQNQFQIAHTSPYADMNNRITQAITNAKNLAQAEKDANKARVDVANAAARQGIVTTKSYLQLYNAYVKAEEARKLDPTNIKKQRAAIDAQAALQQNVSKQQAKAAERAASAATSVTPAWQAATSAGFVATAQYVKLYNAAQKAQLALQRDPTLANQRAYIRANNALQAYVNNVTAANKTIQKQSQVTFASVTQAAESMYQNLLQQNQSAMGTLTQGPFLTGPFMQAAQQFGFKPQPRDYLKDARAQLHQFTSFNRLLDNLRRRGAPEAMIQQLQALGPSSISAIRGITRMSQPELRRYFGVFRDQQKAIHQQTMRDLNHQLRDYLRYGRKVGLAMAAGVRQESPAITKAIQDAVRGAFGNIGRGGGRRRGAGNGSGSGSGSGSGGGGGNHYHDHVHFHGGDDAANDRKLRHHRFKQRQRHNHPDIAPSRN